MLVPHSATYSIKFAQHPFMHLGGERHCESQVSGLNPRLLDQEASAQIIMSPHLKFPPITVNKPTNVFYFLYSDVLSLTLLVLQLA